MNATIYFDMDGTIADLYGVEGWLNDLRSGNSRPYREAKVMLNMSTLARLLNKAQARGYRLGVISWLSKTGTPQYNEEVAQIKLAWLKKHLKSVNFDKIHIVEYGTPKSNFATHLDILFDDEEKNRVEWCGEAYEPSDILSLLKEITKGA